MKRAIILAPSYPETSGYPNDPHWAADAALLAASLAQCGFSVYRTDGQRALLELREQLRQAISDDAALLYFSGYLVLTTTGEPALLFGGDDNHTLGVRALAHRMASQLDRSLMLLDVRAGSEVESAVKVSDDVLAERTLAACEETNVDLVLRLLPWDAVATGDSIALHDVLGQLVQRDEGASVVDLVDTLLAANGEYRILHRASQDGFMLLEPGSQQRWPEVGEKTPVVDSADWPGTEPDLVQASSAYGDAARSESAHPEAARTEPSRSVPPPKPRSLPPPKPKARATRTSQPPPKPHLRKAEPAMDEPPAIRLPIKPLPIKAVTAPPPSQPELQPPPPSWVPPAGTQPPTDVPRSDAELVEALSRFAGPEQASHRVELLLGFLAQHPRHEYALLRVTEELTLAQDWLRLAETYEPLIDQQNDPKRAVELCLAHARLCLKQLQDPQRAIPFIERACELRPRDTDLQLEAAAAYEQRSDVSLAKAHYLAALRMAPLHAPVLHRLCTFFAARRELDRAWQAAAILTHLAQSNASERALYESRERGSLPSVARPLQADEWMLGLEPGRQQPELVSLLELVSDVALRWYEPDAEELHTLREQLTFEDISTSTAMLAGALSWTTQLLRSRLPTLYLSDEAFPPQPLPTTEPAYMVGALIGRGASQAQLVFHWARALSRNSGTARLLRLFPDIEALRTVLGACFVAARLTPPNTTDKSVQLALALRQNLSPEAQRSLVALLDGTRFDDWELRLQEFLQTVETCSNRVGLLACGDPSVAAQALLGLKLDHEQTDRQVADMFRFALGDEYQLLRQRLTISLDQ